MNRYQELISEILPKLYMGGTADNDIVSFPKRLRNLSEREEFDAVVTCYAYAQPMNWYSHENRFAFADGPLDKPTFEKAIELADWLHVKWKNGARSLSRCAMGWNRSGLVMALVLMREGFSSDQAISLIRSKRGPNALCNSDFVKFLHMHEALNKAS